MTYRLFAGAALLAIAAPVAAQQHDHADAAGTSHAGQPAPAPAANPPADHSKMNHGAPVQDADPATPPGHPVDHSAMDHSSMDHSAMDHSGMAHGPAEMNHDMGGEGSGTARLPRNETMNHGAMVPLGGDASLMLHGYLWPVYTNQSGPRGDAKFYVQSMAMATVTGSFAGGRYMARTMLSAEPAMRHDGYPNLFATGEVAYGEPLVDRQHPHDLVMELAGRIDLDVGEDTSAFLYGGPVGEPALGPSAFMHRASARYNPEAPITHHWFDSTHIVYGVVTAGFAAPAWQVEASAFRGREPDEFRWNIETPKLDSWSVRASFSPSPAWLIQASYGQIEEPEAQHPGENEHRTTASAHFNNGSGLSAMAAFSAKDRVPGNTLTAWLGEVNWDIDRHHTLFGRVENVANDELFPDHSDPLHDQAFRVTKFQAGYAYRLPLGPVNLALGGTVSAFAKPDVLDSAYGSNPMGYTVFARFSFGD
ncbi:hypothetical protein [Parafrankia sp. BMG5.11]|uniref:hypothetical protein n=1 Tax=Parafrankia sp. BMG5.11 TaxID=222540 RepID=UPI001A9D6B51|nr:hypothetical protein [Parafrankia sp. BMG5.11]